MNPPKIENPKFFELLKKKQIIPEDFIQDLLAELEGNALDVLATLIQSGVGTKRQLCQLWCDSIGIAHVDLEKSLFQSEVVRKIPERAARKLYAIPIYKLGDTITVATATPDNEEIKKEIHQIVGSPINLVFALPQDIEWAIENEYQTNTALYDFFSKIKVSQILQKGTTITEKKLIEIAGREAINQLHVAMVLFGITENACEIQIDPADDAAKIYFIRNESYQEKMTLDKPLYRQLIQKLRQLAKVDDGQQKQSQYSRIIFPTPGKKIDIQFLSIPTDFGDKIFLKLMDRHPIPRLPSLSELYLSMSNMSQIKNAMQSKQGLILVSGPPESGKTVLAYSILRELKSENISVMTVEDNLKWHLKDIDQYQTNPKAGYKRADVLSSCIKLHPKVIYIQKIEDPELSEMVRKSSESEKIFYIAGIESADVFEAVMKAINLGIHNILSVVINQQCVRRLCDHCKEPYSLTSTEIEQIFVWDQKTKVTAYRQKGCPYCAQQGFFDRIGIQEVVSINDNFRSMLSEKTPLVNIKEAAEKSGYKSKGYDAVKKALRGLITFDELSEISS